MTRKYPYGRVAQDSVRRPFTKEDDARSTASILERMTGDMCVVQSQGTSWHIIERHTPEGKVVRG
jgi:hypothetical protein